jgi:hypothetical protein
MSMVIDMNDEKLKTLEQIREFLAGTEGVEFTHQPDRDTRYQHIADVLCRLRYYPLNKGSSLSSSLLCYNIIHVQTVEDPISRCFVSYNFQR